VAAIDEPTDPRRVVADGYDRVAERYARWTAEEVVDRSRPRYTALLLEHLPPGARVLELGCGGGGPTTRQLAERFALTGVDMSARQVELAGQRLPSATFVLADMTCLTFPPSSFDAVAAFYSLSHLPHGELPRLIGRVGAWLRPGGLFVASLSPRANRGTTEDWLGVPMYFSGYSTEENLRFLAEAGLRVASAQVETILENDRPASFLWVVATRPAPSS
jgi:SAM-dependent methyltransferase